MSPIRIVTDSTADIPPEMKEQLGIEVVSQKVHFGSETFYDAAGLQTEEFYARLAAAAEHPTTSQPSPAVFIELYRRLLEQPGTEIVSIHLSSALSGTYQSALLARSLLSSPSSVTVINSKSASYGVGMLAVLAAKAAGEGKTGQEIVDLVTRARAETRLYFIVDTLEYLFKGGRIGKASALLGSLLQIKPILTIDDAGEVAPVDRVRGQRKATARMIELLRQDFAQRPVDAVIAHAHAPDKAEELSALVREHFEVRDLQFTTIGPVIGVHTGPGATGVFMKAAE